MKSRTAAVLLTAGTLALSGCSALGPWAGAPREANTPAEEAAGDAPREGCEAATADHMKGLGLAKEYLSIDYEYDNEPLAGGPDRIVLTEQEAVKAGFASIPNDLPNGLKVQYIDAIEPVLDARYVLLDGDVGENSYGDILAKGGFILAVSKNLEEFDLAQARLDQARELGTDDQVAETTIAGHHALVSHGDQRGAFRNWRIYWSDAARSYGLDTAIESGVTALDVARAIGCSQR